MDTYIKSPHCTLIYTTLFVNYTSTKLGENTGGNCGLAFDNGFLNMTPKTQAEKKKYINWT